MWKLLILSLCFGALTAHNSFLRVIERSKRQAVCETDTLYKCQSRSQITCNANSKYRTADGSCNNLNNPTWGRESTCFIRILPAMYSDGVWAYRLATNGAELPRPRLVSLNIHHTTPAPDPYLTPLFMLFGQFISHDINLTPFSRSNDNRPLACCGADRNDARCRSIQVGGSGDPFYTSVSQTCLTAPRSIPCDPCIGNNSPVYQINSVTSYIDASAMYGSTDTITNGIRLFQNGELRVFKSNSGQDLLPQDFNNLDQCRVGTGLPCFQAGDTRVNQHLQLTGLHTVWMRYHNYVARELKKRHSPWSDEQLFQEARRIVIAVLQFITYDEYLPFIVGGEQMDCHNLRVYNSSRYTQYNNRIDASMASSFSTAAYRYGHSMVQTIIPMWQSNNRLLRDTFFQPFDLYQDILDDMIKGSSYSGIAELVDPHLVTDITEFLYRTPPTAPFGQDLASLNVNRGRDHGLQPYVKYLELCTYTRVTTFNQLYDFMPSENVRRLRNTYRDVRDIDLFSGGLSEYPVRGGVVGPTFACIIARQFARLKHGDRFYFEHGGQAGSFTLNQLAEIKKMTLSKIFCLVTNIDFIQKYSMERINYYNPEEDCSKANTINFYYF